MRPESDRRPLDDSLAGTGSIRCETVAAALALIAVAVLSAIALADPALATWLTLENGVVEWLQVLLDAGAAVLFARDLVRNARATGRVSPFELAIVACLIGLIMGEVDLDRVLFGTKVAMFTLAGVFGVLSGLALIGITTSADANIGNGYTLLSIAGVILGGGEFVGGRVSPIGAVIGALTLALAASPLLTFMHIPPDWQVAANGAILIIVLAARALVSRREV